VEFPLQSQVVHLDRLPISNNTGGDARVPEDNFKTVMALSLNLNLGSYASFKGVLFQNFTKIVDCYLLIQKVQQFEVTLSIVTKSLRVWLNILSLGANDLSAENVIRNDIGGIMNLGFGKEVIWEHLLGSLRIGLSSNAQQ
jgi:hypothetical protein